MLFFVPVLAQGNRHERAYIGREHQASPAGAPQESLQKFLLTGLHPGVPADGAVLVAHHVQQAVDHVEHQFVRGRQAVKRTLADCRVCTDDQLHRQSLPAMV